MVVVFCVLVLVLILECVVGVSGGIDVDVGVGVGPVCVGVRIVSRAGVCRIRRNASTHAVQEP